MNLWLLLPIGDDDPPEDGSDWPWLYPWGRAHGFVVRADDERDARRLAAIAELEKSDGRSEGWEYSPWIAAKWSECKCIGDGPGNASVVLMYFHQG